MGKADRGVQKVARAGSLAKKELDDISKQVDALKRQLQRTAKRLKTRPELDWKRDSWKFVLGLRVGTAPHPQKSFDYVSEPTR